MSDNEQFAFDINELRKRVLKMEERSQQHDLFAGRILQLLADFRDALGSLHLPRGTP